MADMVTSTVAAEIVADGAVKAKNLLLQDLFLMTVVLLFY
jgi:hypothetical protein